MPTHRYPTLICRDAAGGYSAVTVDGIATAFAASRADARYELRDYLTYKHRKEPWFAGTDFRDAKVMWQTVTVRPEYRTKARTYPCEGQVAVKVVCVVGVRESGQPAADLPLLGIRFDYNNPAELNDLIRRYVLQKLEGCNPEELSRYLSPTEVELLDISVRTPRESASRQTFETAPPTLRRIAEPVGDRAVRKGFARAWCRSSNMVQLFGLLHREKANVLLVGEGGVGKTTLMVDTIKEVETLESADTEGTKRKYWLTSAGRLVAGMKYLGQWEERVETLVSELGEIQGVLCVDRLLDLVRRGGFGPSDSIAAFLMPYLARGEVRLIAEATPAELDACRRLLPALPDLFQIHRVEPFDRGTAVQVIEKQLETAASGHSIEVQRGTPERVVQLFRRFMPYTVFPGPASGFSRELVEVQARKGRKTVDPDDVIDRFRVRTGLPERFLRDELTLAREEVLGWFQTRVIDQPEACAAATDLVMTFKAGLNDPNRPPAVFLFCGPTGVGKTHLALMLAQYFFGAGDATKPANALDRLIRLDMSEYSGFDAVSRLLGPPQGEPSDMIQKVRRQPFSVLLLDEVEKAAPDVFDTLMGVFDEGRLTDPYGRVTNFRSTIIIMTSNLGAGRGSGVGFVRTQEGPQYRDAALRFFRPEFFNRMDAVVTFDPLQPQSVEAITRRELAAINERDGLQRDGISVTWGQTLVEQLAAIGFDARYGARPLQRAIERLVVAQLAQWLLKHPATDPQTILATWQDGQVVFANGPGGS